MRFDTDIRTAICIIIDGRVTVFNVYLYQFTTQKPLKWAQLNINYCANGTTQKGIHAHTYCVFVTRKLTLVHTQGLHEHIHTYIQPQRFFPSWHPLRLSASRPHQPYTRAAYRLASTIPRSRQAASMVRRTASHLATWCSGRTCRLVQLLLHRCCARICLSVCFSVHLSVRCMIFHRVSGI